MEKPRTDSSDHPLRLLSPLTPVSPVSDQRSVLLFDWWLIKVENGSDAKGLAVGGLTTRGQFATRIFSSAPIVKRYDAYTLETADGITVMIQGVINRARMHHSGFPPEVCRHFLTGFPYNWYVHADDIFVKKPTAESIPRSISGVQGIENDLNSNPDGAFPIEIKEFPLKRVLDILNFCGSPAEDVMASNMTNCLKSFDAHHTSMDPTTQKSPDMKNCSSPVMKTCSEDVILSKFEREMRNHQQAESEVNIGDSVVQRRVATHVEEVGHQKDTLVSDSLLANGFDLRNIKSSHNSSAKPSMDDSLPETGSSLQMKILLGETKQKEPDNHQSPKIQGKQNISQIENVTDRNCNDRSAANMAGVAMEIGIASEGLDVSHLKDEKELKNILLEKGCGAKETMICSRNNFQSRKVFDPKDADLVDVKLSVAIETSPNADVSNSLEKPNVSSKKQKCVSKGSRKRLSLEKEKMSSILRSDYAHINYADEEPRKSDILKAPNITSGISNHTSLEEINDACLGVLEKINNCFVNPVMNRTAEAGSVTDAERVKTSEAGFCSRLSRKKPNVQANIQKEHKCELGDGKFDSHSPMRPPKSVTNGLDHSEENSRCNSLSLTEEQPSTKNGNGLINFGTEFATCESQLATPKGQTKRCVDRRTKVVEEIETNSETRILRKKKLNIKQKDNEMEKSVLEEDVRKNTVSSVPVDKNVASVAKDTVVKERGHVGEMAQNKVQKRTGRIRKKEQDIQHECGGLRSGPSAPCEVQLGTGRINDHIRIDNSDEGKSFQFSVGCDTKPASQSVDAMECHTTVDNTIGRTKKRHRKRNHQIGGTYATRALANRLSFASPENLNLRRSRSGRLLVPALANWCQHLIYDVDGTITGIVGVDAQNLLSSGSISEQNKKRKKIR
ncbi:SANT associated domain-containing protein [Dioscorea alata]|uniref:SANT associated domain-containing protein n=1 Tax=Dioscorea alata TaxID=55571 RepID=A0ACB7VAJ2_DIOAL|nr:SANT associated domain-containing protein [Dioscorea alata]